MSHNPPAMNDLDPKTTKFSLLDLNYNRQFILPTEKMLVIIEALSHGIPVETPYQEPVKVREAAKIDHRTVNESELAQLMSMAQFEPEAD